MSSLLVLGGTRSGKSRFAEEQVSGEAVYIATAECRDAEMRQRIALHRERRGTGWATLEEPLDLVAVLGRESGPRRFLLVDCLTLWVSNLMEVERDVDLEVQALASSLAALPGRIILVSNEVGQGIVPDNELARRFRDHQGRCNQVIARAADDVVLMAAGLPLWLKREGRLAG